MYQGTQMPIFVLFVSARVLFDGTFPCEYPYGENSFFDVFPIFPNLSGFPKLLNTLALNLKVHSKA